MIEDIQLRMERNLAVVELNQLDSLILSRKPRDQLKSCIEKIIKNPSIHVALLIFKNTCSQNSFSFSRYALIEKIEKTHGRERWERLLDEVHELFNLIETANVSWVAAIQGACLGHHLELVITCDYRIADFKNAGFGLPDLSLGLMPCFGACVRMPRLIGVRKALQMILSGQTISSREAYLLGLINKVVHPLDLEEQARNLAEQIIKGHLPPKPLQQYKPLRFLEKCFEIPIGRQILYYITKKRIVSETKGFYPAPLKVLEVIKNNYPVKYQKIALKEESDAFCDLIVSPTTGHLISLYLNKEKIKKRFDTICKQADKSQILSSSPAVASKPIGLENFGLKSLDTKGNRPGSYEKTIIPPGEQIKKVAVIGAGAMGGGITRWLAQHPVSVLLKDIHSPSLSAALRFIYSEKVGFEKIRPQMDYSGFQNGDLVIETVVEDLEIKKKVIAETASYIPDRCLFATNTSSFKITELAKAHPNPSRFFGLHFFYPAYRTPLVEVVRGEQSSDDTIFSAAQWVRKLGKIPFVVKDSTGFLVQRVLLPFMSEAFWFLNEGFSIQQIDQIYTAFGFSMGPFRLMDELGLDICLKLIRSTQLNKQDLSFPENVFKLRSVFLGRKNKNGFYIYDEKGKVESINNLIYKDLQFKPASRNITTEECLERGLYRMVNEATKILEEQVVATPEELDLALILSIGFPAFRGGLLKYADETNLKTIVAGLNNFASTKGERFHPSSALLTQLDKGKTFYK